jgi:hypothetical protein
MDYENYIMTHLKRSRVDNYIKYYASNIYYEKYEHNNDYFIVINSSIDNKANYSSLMVKMGFNNIYNQLHKEIISDRGNYNISYGYSVLNLNEVDEDSHIRRPCLNKNTLNNKDLFVNLSDILRYSTNIENEMMLQSSNRVMSFASKIDSNNIIEGITCAYTNVSCIGTKEKTQYYKCHVDTNNSQLEPFNFCIIAAKVLKCKEKMVRVSAIGYCRKSIDDFYYRDKLFTPILNVINQHYISLKSWQKEYNSNALVNRKFCNVVEEKVFLCKPNINIKSFYHHLYLLYVR